MPRAFLVHQKKKKRVHVLYHEHEEGCTHDDVDGSQPMKREREDYSADSPISEKLDSAESEGELRVQSDHEDSRTSPSSSPEPMPKKCDLKASENSAFNKINKQHESMLTGMEYLYSKGFFPYANPFFQTYPIPFMDYAKYGHPGFYGSNDKVLDLSRVREEALASSRLHLPYVDPRLSLTSYYQSLARMAGTGETPKVPTSPLNRSLAENETFKREDVIDGREAASNPGSPSSQKSHSPSRSPSASQGSPQTPPSALSVASLIASPSGAAASRPMYPYPGVNVPRYSPGSISSGTPMAQMEPALTGQPLVAGASTSSVHPAIQNYLTSGRRPNTDKPPPIKKYKCDVCHKAFSRSNTLVTHKRIHTGDKPFKCEVCGRAFRQPGNLTRHRLTHTTVKPYVCNTCNKAFNRASNLHTHMRTHTNYKPFVCPYCGKGFHQKIDMKIHSYTHTGEKPHHCSICGRGFKQLTHLTYHMRTHSEAKMYRCHHCGKGFNQKGNLQAHVYGHTGERPHICDICLKGFTLASTLNTHRRTHADSKPFACRHCGKDFYQKSSLKSHLIASHPYTRENRCYNSNRLL